MNLKKALKSDFKKEYVRSHVLSERQRCVISKMINGTYPLEIELGRYRGVPSKIGYVNGAVNK